MVVVMKSCVGFNKTKLPSISRVPDYVDPTKDRKKQQNKKHYRKKEKTFVFMGNHKLTYHAQIKGIL